MAVIELGLDLDRKNFVLYYEPSYKYSMVYLL